MKKLIVIITLLVVGLQLPFSLSGQVMNLSTYQDTSLPNIEHNPDYGFVYPVYADVMDSISYTPSYYNRYFMSLFGPRYKSTSTSSIGYYDFHQGMDVTNLVSYNGIQYNDTNEYYIVSSCDGVVNYVLDSTDIYLETTGTGRSVRIKCDSSYRNNSSWGRIYINYRHLSDLYTLTDSAKSVPINTVSISKGDTVGMVGESGLTTNVHLHYSIQRYQSGTSTTSFKNVHPKRIFPPDVKSHLHHSLDSVHMELLGNWTDSAVFRFTFPYNQMCVKRIEISNNIYSELYDYEHISDSLNRDNHNLIPNLEVFAYSFNRGSKALTRYNSTKGTMPPE